MTDRVVRASPRATKSQDGKASSTRLQAAQRLQRCGQADGGYQRVQHAAAAWSRVAIGVV
eukprot:scaffold26720_cov124-Isochrysis_galbana.AAC.8